MSKVIIRLPDHTVVNPEDITVRRNWKNEELYRLLEEAAAGEAVKEENDADKKKKKKLAEMCRNPRGENCGTDGGGGDRYGDRVCGSGYGDDHLDGASCRCGFSAHVDSGTAGM